MMRFWIQLEMNTKIQELFHLKNYIGTGDCSVVFKAEEDGDLNGLPCF